MYFQATLDTYKFRINFLNQPFYHHVVSISLVLLFFVYSSTSLLWYLPGTPLCRGHCSSAEMTVTRGQWLCRGSSTLQTVEVELVGPSDSS